MSSSDLLNAGTVCSHNSCRTIDFLPFKCSHCSQNFCQEHWKAQDHECKNYDPASEDRIVPQCPLCSLPVLVQPRQNPNQAMERHINNDCSVSTGKKRRGPHCENKKCGKSLISPIICDTCKGQFCPAHRFPSDHTCVTPSSKPVTTPKAPVISPAGIAALKRVGASASNAVRQNVPAKTTVQSKPKQQVGSNASTSGATNLFNEIKTDRCESSPSASLSPAPTVSTLPLDRPRSVVPDATKKWVPRSIFASA
ncbi:hypothetical protein M408DRAFT_330585 [Serendipita vermifera MAFF 305830]|uniref:AN1-type domain-containing protein n=1 Tax=Serendipita vermifera MAFF 305830 TaxID=933852 RepID=A0A0C3B4H4_SERVB|nr:hypothetical protein M408DRAFT_330585 [Serendipita vermifera MAFF 305830]